jgi:hypothetical protein
MNLALVILGIIIVAIGSLITGVGWNWDKFHKQRNETKETLAHEKNARVTTSTNQSGGVTAQTVTINNYFDSYSFQSIASQEALKRRYPLGYAVFAADEKTIKVPNGLTFERDFEIKWANAKVWDLKADTINFDLPDIIYKPTGNKLVNIGFSFPRKVGYATPLPFVDWKQSIPILEVLADEGDFVVLVLGFREN